MFALTRTVVLLARSRRKRFNANWLLALATRLLAELLNNTNRPSALMTGATEFALPPDGRGIFGLRPDSSCGDPAWAEDAAMTIRQDAIPACAMTRLNIIP